MHSKLNQAITLHPLFLTLLTKRHKNGLRIQPQEMVEVEPGDEIRFGKRNFCSV